MIFRGYKVRLVNDLFELLNYVLLDRSYKVIQALRLTVNFKVSTIVLQ